MAVKVRIRGRLEGSANLYQPYYSSVGRESIELDSHGLFIVRRIMLGPSVGIHGGLVKPNDCTSINEQWKSISHEVKASEFGVER